MNEIGISVNLEERELTVFTTVISLSNYDIKHLRLLSDSESFGEAECEKAVRKLLEKQIIPFIRSTGRTVCTETVEEEVKQAFHSHLYNYIF